MSKAFLTSILIVLAGFSSQCLLGSKQIDPQTNSPKQSANDSVPIETQSRPNDLKMENDLQSQYKAIQNRIKGESLKFKIENLREAVFDSETETRIWVGFGLTYPRCVILKNLGGKQKALYIAPKITGNKAVADKRGEVLITKTVLDAPRLGWDQFYRFLKEQGIDIPIKLSLDEKHIPDPDERMIVIEAKSRAQYSMVFFSLDTESEDGQKALKVCRTIEQEFNIRMGCGNP